MRVDNTVPVPEEPSTILPPRKHPNIPLLSSYKCPPAPSFWEHFPQCDLPKTPQSQVQPLVLESYLHQVEDKLTVHQTVRAKLACSEIRTGTDACQLQQLPGIRVANASSVYKHGAIFTDTLAEWVQKKFVAGPFSVPPVDNFRCNSMIAIEKKGKIRIVMNMSGPEGYSFNENIDTLRLEKISTSSARAFGYSVVECGKGARMWKFDLKDAYKNLPAKEADLRLQGFKQPINRFLADFHNNENVVLQMPAQAKADLKVWMAAVAHSTNHTPLPPRPLPPPLGALVFVSDAAGVKFARVQGQRKPLDEPGERGAASIGLTAWGSVWFFSSIRWPSHMLTKATDSKGCAYGCKSATLEAVGLLLPFVTIPGRLRNKAVRLQVDNISLVYGWINKHLKNDDSASIFIRSIHLIAVMLNCVVEVEHLPRVTSPAAILADNLSRNSTTTEADRRAVEGAATGPIPRALTDWLNSPCDDWDLPLKLLDHAKALAK